MPSITRIYHFESGHFLPNVRDGHKCKRQHGHNYKMEVTVSGEPDPHVGFIIDFWDLDDIVNPVIKRVDHYNLNDIEGLENPTAELIAQWFYNRLHTSVGHFIDDKDYVICLDRITIWETPECSASYP